MLVISWNFDFDEDEFEIELFLTDYVASCTRQRDIVKINRSELTGCGCGGAISCGGGGCGLPGRLGSVRSLPVSCVRLIPVTVSFSLQIHTRNDTKN